MQRIPVRKEEIAPFEGNPGLGEVLLPLTDRVRALAAGTRCARYVVVTRGIEPEFPHVGLGIESPQKIFPLARPYVYAYMTARDYDGETFAQLGAITDQSAIHTVDESLWPDPPNSAAQNARLREAIRELVAQRLDKMLTELRRPF